MMRNRATIWWSALVLVGMIALAGCTAKGYSTAGSAGTDYLLTPTAASTGTAATGDDGGVASEPVSSNPVIMMGVSVFAGSHNLQVKAGTAIQIQNTVDGGGLHLLYMGKIGKFEAEPGAPAALNSANGIILQKGETGTYSFTTAGTYYLTCQYHPSMIVKITVTP